MKVILELRDEEFNVKKIIAVIDATFAVVKRKPEEIQACTGFEPLTSVIPVQRFDQLSYPANWELVI